MGGRRAKDEGSGPRRALVAAVLAVLLLVVLFVAAYAALLGLREGEGEAVARVGSVGSAAAERSSRETGPREPAQHRVEIAGESGEQLGPSSAPVATLQPEPAAPASEPVLVTGAAVRISPDGEEHVGDDGAFELWVRSGGAPERLSVEVVGGRFAVEVPRGDVLHVSGLELAGRPLFLERDEYNVPAAGFLLVRGHELSAVLLHVVSAEDGRELDGVELWPTAHALFGTSYEHPGAAPTGEPVVSDATSPVSVATRAGGSHASRGYWVRARDHAWAGIALDHSAPGERTVERVPAGAL
jgi:hypothetical protein